MFDTHPARNFRLLPRQESLRLWLLCSACADKAAAAEKEEAARVECQPWPSKFGGFILAPLWQYWQLRDLFSFSLSQERLVFDVSRFAFVHSSSATNKATLRPGWSGAFRGLVVIDFCGDVKFINDAFVELDRFHWAILAHSPAFASCDNFSSSACLPVRLTARLLVWSDTFHNKRQVQLSTSLVCCEEPPMPSEIFYPGSHQRCLFISFRLVYVACSCWLALCDRCVRAWRHLGSWETSFA